MRAHRTMGGTIVFCIEFLYLKFHIFPDIMEKKENGGMHMRRILALLLILPVLAGCGKEKETQSTAVEGTVEEIFAFGGEEAEGT